MSLDESNEHANEMQPFDSLHEGLRGVYAELKGIQDTLNDSCPVEDDWTVVNHIFQP